MNLVRIRYTAICDRQAARYERFAASASTNTGQSGQPFIWLMHLVDAYLLISEIGNAPESVRVKKTIEFIKMNRDFLSIKCRARLFLR